MAYDDLQETLSENPKSYLANRKVLVVLVVVIVVLGVVIISLAAGLGHALSRANSASGEPVNAKYPANEFSLRALQSMNPDIDYCDNFYQYACGGWIERENVHPDSGYVSTWSQLFDANEERLRELLEEPIERNTPISIERKVKQLYKMCLHDYGRSSTGAAPLVTIITDQLGGWYALDPDGWTQSPWDFTGAFAKLQGEYLVDVFMHMDIVISPKDHLTRVLTVEAGGLGMDYRIYKVKTEHQNQQDAYKDYMRETAKLLLRDAGLTLTSEDQTARVDQFVSDAYGHESKMAQKLLASPNNEETLHTTVGGLATSYTQVEWQAMFQGMFKELGHWIAPNITTSTEVIVTYQEYFHFLEEVFKDEAEERDRIFNNYMVWRLLDTYASDLSWEYQHAKQRFTEASTGRLEFVPTWQRCVDMIRERVPEALSSMWGVKHSSLSENEHILEMVDKMKQALVQRFDELDWMDDATRSRANEKVIAMEELAVFAPNWLNVSFVDNFFIQYEVNEADGYFTSLLNVNRYLQGMNIVDYVWYAYYMLMDSLEQAKMDVRPKYFHLHNTVVIPLGSLITPMYSPDSPQFGNYGQLGSEVAYVMAQAVNKQGRYEWIDGTTMDWWTTASAANYNQGEKCFLDQFSGIRLGPYLVDGENKTIMSDAQNDASRLVDLQAGFRVSHRVYMEWAEEDDNQEEGLSGLTAEQSVFLAMTQAHCIKARDTTAYGWAELKQLPEELMVNGILKNMPEFATAFQCAPDSKMSLPSEDICKVF